MKKLNTCYYSSGSKHECCTHQQYCIFNQKRDQLERKIRKNWLKYYELKKIYNSYLKGYYCRDIDYDFLLKKLDLVKHNISRLVQFRNKIINGEVDGYGFEILESKTI